MDLYFAGREVTLEVGHIVHCVPQTEFHIGKYLKFLEFRHFERHIVFSQSERKEKKKAISNGVNVQVVVRV